MGGFPVRIGDVTWSSYGRQLGTALTYTDIRKRVTEVVLRSLEEKKNFPST